MEPTIQLPTLLAALMFGAMLATYSQVVALRRKGRDDRHRYQQRIRRNHGEPRQERETHPRPRRRPAQRAPAAHFDGRRDF